MEQVIDIAQNGISHNRNILDKEESKEGIFKGNSSKYLQKIDSIVSTKKLFLIGPDHQQFTNIIKGKTKTQIIDIKAVKNRCVISFSASVPTHTLVQCMKNHELSVELYASQARKDEEDDDSSSSCSSQEEQQDRNDAKGIKQEFTENQFTQEIIFAIMKSNIQNELQLKQYVFSEYKYQEQVKAFQYIIKNYDQIQIALKFQQKAEQQLNEQQQKSQQFSFLLPNSLSDNNSSTNSYSSQDETQQLIYPTEHLVESINMNELNVAEKAVYLQQQHSNQSILQQEVIYPGRTKQSIEMYVNKKDELIKNQQFKLKKKVTPLKQQQLTSLQNTPNKN